MYSKSAASQNGSLDFKLRCFRVLAIYSTKALVKSHSALWVRTARNTLIHSSFKTNKQLALSCCTARRNLLKVFMAHSFSYLTPHKVMTCSNLKALTPQMVIMCSNPKATTAYQAHSLSSLCERWLLKQIHDIDCIPYTSIFCRIQNSV